VRAAIEATDKELAEFDEVLNLASLCAVGM
jgi:hypothetical protein